VFQKKKRKMKSRGSSKEKATGNNVTERVAENPGPRMAPRSGGREVNLNWKRVSRGRRREPDLNQIKVSLARGSFKTSRRILEKVS